jgi:hypothetical protein
MLRFQKVPKPVQVVQSLAAVQSSRFKSSMKEQFDPNFQV